MTPLFVLAGLAPAAPASPLQATPTPAATFAASSRAHRALTRFRATATLMSAGSNGAAGRTTYELTVDRSTVLVRIQQPADRGRSRSDRSFLFKGNLALGYDAIANETLKRTVPAGRTNLERIEFVLGPSDEMLRSLMDSGLLQTFYANFQRLSYWKRSTVGGAAKLVRDVPAPGGRNVTVFRFAPKTNLLVGYSLKSSEGAAQWTIRYDSPTIPRLRVPASARRVDAFTVAPPPPTYASAAARRIAGDMVDAYRSLRSVAMTIRTGRTSVRVLLDGRKFREENDTTVVTYDGRQLAILDRGNRRIARGVASRNRIPEYVAAAGCEMDPMSRQILQGFVPFRDLLIQGRTVSVGGSLTMNGVACDLLRLDGAGSRVTLSIRRDNHLVDAASSVSLDRNGRPLTSTARRYEYRNVNRPLSATNFDTSARAGYGTSPLPVIPRT